MPDSPEAVRQALAGRYEILREIGAGGMATVHLAADLKHARQVAIKILRPELAATLGAERFIREIEIASALQHPHILPLHDSGEAGGFLYYVMPYIDGETLRDRMTREVQLGLDDAIKIARQVGDALQHAHDHGVVHRDIKPRNILLSSGHPVVADFGIATARDVAGRTKLTSTGLVLGSVGYMSPEQMDGSQVDGRADIYSLGCVLYEMIVGERPYTGPTSQVVFARSIAGPIPSARVARGTVSPELDAALTCALAPTPADRFQTADDFVAAITGVTTVTSSVAYPGHAGLFTRGRRAAAIAVVLAVAGGLWGVQRFLSPPPTTPQSGVPTLVVLPFDNLGAGEDEYFADGVAEQITTRLSQLNEFGVIARSTAGQYKGTEKSVPEIGRELGVEYVLLGTVRWQRTADGLGQVRVTPRLVRASDATSIWTDDYDQVLSNIFDVQDRIAAQVASALGAAFEPATRVAVTENLAAYDAYLRGNGYFHTGRTDREALQLAIDSYHQAADLDPGFVEPLWSLVKAYSNATFNQQDPTSATAAKAALDRAMVLAPDETGMHIAQGWYHYWALGELETALEHFTIARDRVPNDTEVTSAMGYVSRRLGRWDAALDLLLEAFELNPREDLLAVTLGRTYLRLRRFTDAARFFDLAISIDPTLAAGYRKKLMLHLASGAPTDSIATFVQVGSSRVGQRWKTSAEPGVFMVLSLLSSHSPDVLYDFLRPAVGGEADQHSWRLLVDAALARQSGDRQGALARYDSARVAVEGLAEAQPENTTVLLTLAHVYAELGQVELARQSAERAAALEPVEADAMDTWPLEVLARVLARTDQGEEALAILERLANMPSLISAAILRLDPAWDSIRDDARFQRLLETTD